METRLGPPTRDFSAGEFVLVMALAFGMAIMGSLAAAFSYRGTPIEFGDATLLGTVAYEVVVGAILWAILRSRAWKWNDFAVHASTGSTILGLILAGVVLAVWYVLEATLGKVPVTISTSLPVVAMVSVINPIFEELFVLAYVVQSLRKRFGLTTAFNVSLGIRVAYHLYQGPLAVLPIAFFGFVVTWVFVRMGRLWPVIVAHGIVDFVGLSME